MATVEDINATIAQTAADGIANAQIAGQSTTVLSIDEQIKAANHLAGQPAAAKSGFGLRFAKLIPPGCG
jgi:hypothetical protein